ncbi:MAG: vitamin K epoxide reductase [Chlamydiae bacterium]|nr:vitamin K epoxide reductase [Chlamydiota bacterium]
MNMQAPIPISRYAIPEPWHYNPSKWSQRITICLVATIATLIAIYLGLYQWRLVDSIWDPIFGVQSMQVLDSDVSHELSRWFRIPDGIFGAWAYLGDIIFGLAGSTRRWYDRPWIVILFGFDVIPLGIVSAILVAMQGFVVGAFCTLCLATAVISIILVFLAYDEVWSCILLLYRVWKRSKNFRILWNTFWGHPSNIAYQIAGEMVKKRENKKRK